jgi:hypothetical protein
MRERVEKFFECVGKAVAETAVHATQLDSLMMWMTTIASSSLRAYRHTATLAAIALARALAGSAHSDASKLRTAKRQSVAADKRRSKTPSSSSAPGATPQPKRELERLAARVTRFDQLLTDFFDGYTIVVARRFASFVLTIV